MSDDNDNAIGGIGCSLTILITLIGILAWLTDQRLDRLEEMHGINASGEQLESQE